MPPGSNDGRTAEELSLTPDGWLAENDIAISLGSLAASIDRVAQTATTDASEIVSSDMVVFSIRTADRLERTTTWLNKLEGDLDYL